MQKKITCIKLRFQRKKNEKKRCGKRIKNPIPNIEIFFKKKVGKKNQEFSFK